MASMNLLRAPTDVDDNTWFYEEMGGLLVVHQVIDNSGQHLSTDTFTIPWRKIQAALKRRGKVK